MNKSKVTERNSNGERAGNKAAQEWRPQSNAGLMAKLKMRVIRHKLENIRQRYRTELNCPGFLSSMDELTELIEKMYEDLQALELSR